MLITRRPCIACATWLISAMGVVLVAGCAHNGAGPERLDHRTNAQAVKDVLAGKRTLASAAWWGFDEQDSTEALQAAINSGVARLVVPNMGKPWIVRPLSLEGNQEIIFEPGTVVMARKGAFLAKSDCLFTAKDKENITLRGPGASLVMHKPDYVAPPYEKAEWRHCLSLRGCRNITVQGLRLAASGGDGIYVGRGTSRGMPCRDITIKDVICEDHHRQGISVITAENLLIERCTIRGTQGTAPQAGIDFEPNHADERLVNCVVRDCTIDHNAGYGILLYLAPLRSESEPVSVTLERCRIADNRRGALAVQGSKKAGKLRGTIQLRENELAGKQDFDDWPMLQIQGKN